ncbi:MAG TPA: hypothetical protein VF092_27365 [Longimicrobium sp.]
MSLEEPMPSAPAASAPASQPPEPSLVAAPSDPNTPPGGQQQRSTLTDIEAGRDVLVENSIDNSVETSIYNGDVYYQVMAAQRRTVRRSTLADGQEVSRVEEEWAVEHFAGIEGEADTLVRHLEERRVLLLCAPSGARKVTAATHLALRLRERGTCTQPAAVFDPPERHVPVDLHQLAAKHAQFADRLVVFRNTLSRGNPDLHDAFAKTDRAGWAQLADRLRARNAYVVFTATPAETGQFHDAHALQGLLRSLDPHSSELRAARLDRHLGALQQPGGTAAETLQAVRGFRDQLLERFPFSSQAADFVDFFVDLGQPSLGFDEGLALFQDASRRLLYDFGDDFDGWSFGFVLALAQCTPDAAGVAWVDFDRLRRHLRRWLQRDLQLADGARAQDDDEPSEVRLELSDDSLLTRSRATIKKDPFTLADVVSFRDEVPPQGLWRMLLGRHRRVLTAILPRLRDLAERPDQDGPSMSVLAAQIIGRIGEIDYQRVVVPMAERWATLGNKRHRGLVGAMFEGVLGSNEPQFRARCLQFLRSMHAGGATGRDGDLLQAAITAYSWVGYYDFPRAMHELYGIVRVHLVPMIENASRMSRLVSGIQADIERAAQKGDDMLVRKAREVLRRVVDKIYAERAGVFLSVQFALVSLCEAHGVAPVLRELREWIKRGGASMGVLIALMFLHERGIANQLRDDRVELPRGDALPPVSCGQFVRALANGDEDVHQAVRFLGDLYESVTTPWAAEGLVRRHFRDQLQGHLLEWVQDALPVSELAEPMRRMVEQLSRTHEGKMREMIVQLLNGAEFRRRHELRSFAASLQV